MPAAGVLGDRPEQDDPLTIGHLTQVPRRFPSRGEERSRCTGRTPDGRSRTRRGAQAGSRPVHGRAAAGGWSQHRFARRREGQARTALDAAADAAAAVLLPAAASLDAVVAGGDRRAVDGVLADPRLASLRALLAPRLLDVPDPRSRVLEDSPRLFRALPIRGVEPA